MSGSLQQEVEFQRQAKIIVANVLAGALNQIKKEESLKGDITEVLGKADKSDELFNNYTTEYTISQYQTPVAGGGDIGTKSGVEEMEKTVAISPDIINVLVESDENENKEVTKDIVSDNTRRWRISSLFRQRRRENNIIDENSSKRQASVGGKKTRPTFRRRLAAFFCCGKSEE